MAVNYYRWDDDASAPVMDGTTGSLIDVLEACLVDGYTGKTAAGWTKEYHVGNIAVFRHAASEAYFRFCDANAEETIGTAPINGNTCTIRGFMTMSDEDTGTNMFPSVASSAYYGIHKSATADSTARNWSVIEDNGLVYLIIDSHATYHGSTVVFGKFKSNVVGDQYNFIIGAGYLANSQFMYQRWFLRSDLWLCRGADSITESVAVDASITNGLFTGMGLFGSGGVSTIDGKINLREFLIGENVSGVDELRGTLPGIFFSLENMTTYDMFDTFSSDDATTDYVITKQYLTSAIQGIGCIQTNLSWDW